MPEKAQGMNLLIISAYFAPGAQIGGQRATKLACSIGDLGWRPYVLTISEACSELTDPSFDMSRLESVPVVRVPCSSPWNHSRWWYRLPPGPRRTALRLLRVPFKITEPLLLTTGDVFYPWSLRATSKGVSLARDNAIDLIWATVPQWSAAHLAYRIWRRTGVPYVVDFRDVRHLPERLGARWVAHRAMKRERAAVENAAGITTVAPGQFEALCRLHPAAIRRPHCLVYNWFEKPKGEPSASHKFDRRTILHGGSLYGGERRMDGFLGGLARLKSDAAFGKTGLQFLQYGLAADLLPQQARRYGVSDIVTVHPMVPSELFRAYCRASDVLLLVVGRSQGHVEHAGAVPGKVYEYFAARRPILVVGPPGCVAGRMVERIRRGLAAPDDQPDQIAEALRRLLDPSQVRSDIDLSDDAIKDYQGSTVVPRLAAFLGSLVKT
jgi:glycosyltransferase involved in cell wall biosynthesis